MAMAEDNSILESQLIVHNLDELLANIPLNSTSIDEHASSNKIPNSFTTRINDFNSVSVSETVVKQNVVNFDSVDKEIGDSVSETVVKQNVVDFAEIGDSVSETVVKQNVVDFAEIGDSVKQNVVDFAEIGDSVSETVVKQNVVDFVSDDKEICDSVSETVVKQNVVDFAIDDKEIGDSMSETIVKQNVVDLRERLNVKRRNLGRENELIDEIDVRKNVGDLREKLNFKRRNLGRENELMGEIDARKNVDESVAFKERDLELRLKAFEKQNKILGVKERKVKEYREMLDLKEKNLLGRLELKEKLVEKRLVAIKTKERDLLGSLELKEKLVEERLVAIELKEKNLLSSLQLKEQNIEERNRVIGAKEIDIDRRSESVAVKERDLELREKELDKQNEILGAKEKAAKKYMRVLKSKEKLVDEGLVDIESKKKNLLGSLELKEKLAEERLVAIELKEKEIEKRFVAIKVNEESAMSEFCKAVEWKLTQMKVHYDAMEVEERQEKNRDFDGELRTKKINRDNERLTLGEKEDGECGVVGRCEDLECTDDPRNLKQMNVRLDRVEVEEKQERILNLDGDLRAKKLNGDNEGLICNEKEHGECVGVLGDHCEDLERMDNPANECIEPQDYFIEKQMNASKEKKASSEEVQLETEKVGDNGEVVEECIGDVIQEKSKELKVTHVIDDLVELKSKNKPFINFHDPVNNNLLSNGKNLQTYLNERADKHESMGEHVKYLLKSLSDPAKVVLDAVDGFYAPPLNQDVVAFELSVVRSSCLLLLEQLMSIGPLITDCLKREAEIVAFKWMTNMKIEGMSETLVLGFLLLVGTYTLFASFSWQNLEKLCKVVDRSKLAPQLRLRLCLAAKKRDVTCLTQVKRRPSARKFKKIERSLPRSNSHDVVCNTMDERRGRKINDAKEESRLNEKVVGEHGGVGDDWKDLEKQGNAPCEDLTLMDSQVNAYIEPPGLVEKIINEPGDLLESKEQEVSQVRGEVPELRAQAAQHINVTSNAHDVVSSTLRGKQINNSNKELRLKDKKVGECGVGDDCQELEKEEKQVNAPCEDLTLVDSQVNEYIEPQGLIEEKINASSDQLKSKENEPSDQVWELRAKHINGFPSQLEAVEAPMSGEDVQLENTQIGNNGKVAEEPISDATTKVEKLKETHVNDNHGELELKQKPLSNCDKMSKGDSFTLPMNGKLLQNFLNEKADKHESMGELIKSLLRSSQNPAKVVLDAVDGFFAPPLNQDDPAFELSVVRSSCLLLLEQLMSINPVINEDLKLEAETVATKWMSNMRVEGMSDVPVLGFLLLVSSYNLISSFPWEALERLQEMVDKHKLAPQLRQRLSFHKSHDGTCSLTLTKRKLPPSNAHDVVCSTVDRDLRGKQINDANKRLRLKEKEVGECGVGDNCQDLEKEDKQVNAPCEDLTLSGYQVNENIEQHGLIEKQINECNDPLESKETEVSDEVHELKAKDINAICSLTQAGRELPPSDTVGIVSSTLDSSSAEVCSDIHLLCKEMDRHGVRSYMIRFMKEDNLLHDKIFDALRSASDPTKLVLDISKSFFETDLDEADSYFFKISCLHLLEQLIKLSPSITPDVGREARDYADVWMKRLNDKTGRDAPVNHFVFLHFVAAYKLARYSGWNKLLQIFKSSYIAAKRYPPEKNVDLCRALGLTDKIPGFVRRLIKKQKHLEAIKCVSLFKMECDFPPVPLIEAYLELGKQKVGEQIKKASLEGKEVFPDVMELSHLNQARSYIQSLDLPSVFPTDSLSSRITQLRKEINARKETTESSRKRQAIPIDSSRQLQKRPRV